MPDPSKGALAPRIAALVPREIWHRLVHVDLLLPYYHVVGDGYLPHVSELYSFRTVREFAADLEFFARSYRPVALADLIEHLDGGRKLPPRCFLPTFDDGFREIHDVIAPVLRKYGSSAVFFLNPAALDNRDLCYPQKISLLLAALAKSPGPGSVRRAYETFVRAGVQQPDLASCLRTIRYEHRHLLDEISPLLGCDFRSFLADRKPFLTSEQVADLIKSGFAIGAHSIDHPRYPELSLADQVKQTRESFSQLSQRFSYRCRSFAFPYADVGVGKEFFDSVFADPQLRVTFGTAGMVPHFFPRNLERFSMERTTMPAAHIVARQFGRTFVRYPFGFPQKHG